MISFVIPVYNEKESLQAFYKELKKELASRKEKYEIIFVDDGSIDTSLEILKSFARENNSVRIFSFRTNLGKSEALTCGFQKAKGDYIITMDADLQDRPSEIRKLLEKTKEGVEVVCGWRKERKDKSQMKIISQLFNRIVGNLFNLHLHDYNCGLKLYTKDAAKSLRLYGGLHRFIPLLAFEQGFVVDEVAVEHAPRKFGHSKYGFSKLWKDLPDLFTMFFLAKYGKRPLHFFGTVGSIVLLLGVGIFIYLGTLWLQGESIGRRPLFFSSILFILGGLQIFFTGFLADLMINISQRPQSPDGSSHFPLKFASDKEQK